MSDKKTSNSEPSILAVLLEIFFIQIAFIFSFTFLYLIWCWVKFNVIPFKTLWSLEYFILIIGSIVPALVLFKLEFGKWLFAPHKKKQEGLKSILILLFKLPKMVFIVILMIFKITLYAIGFVIVISLILGFIYGFIWVIGYIFGAGFKSA